MKQKLVLAVLLATFAAKGFCQTTNGVNIQNAIEKAQNSISPATKTATLKIVTEAAVYINGKHYNSSIMKTISPQDIDKIDVDKSEVVIDNVKYSGQIYIQMKKEYQPHFVTLTDMQQKYAKQTSMPTVFLIDNGLVKEDYADYMIDEKQVLKVIVDSTKSQVAVINLITKTNENTKQTDNFRIRGLAQMK
jgi:hypothetical protein